MAGSRARICETTWAEELAATRPALRLTPDHWMIPLFGDSLADGKRFVLEGRPTIGLRASTAKPAPKRTAAGMGSAPQRS